MTPETSEEIQLHVLEIEGWWLARVSDGAGTTIPWRGPFASQDKARRAASRYAVRLARRWPRRPCG